MDELLDTLTDTESIHESARVWITTEVHPKFPISLLQVCTSTLWQGVSTGSHTHVSILCNVFIVHNTYICTYVCVCVSDHSTKALLVILVPTNDFVYAL